MSAPKLKIEVAPIADLKTHPRNPRRGDIEAIADSLAQHEQYQPIVVQRSTGFVLVGNHRLMAAEALGWEEIQVVYLDVDDDEATRILLVDNRTSDLGDYDNAELVALLESLPDLSGTGYRPDDLEIMAADLELPDIIPGASEKGGGDRVLADTIAWGYIGWGKAKQVRITAGEVAAMNAYYAQHKEETGSDAGFLLGLFGYARDGGYIPADPDAFAKADAAAGQLGSDE